MIFNLVFAHNCINSGDLAILLNGFKLLSNIIITRR